MNYELAKELKDAGFPQDKSEYFFVVTPNAIERLHCTFVERVRHITTEIVSDPTLEELIEACGEGFDGLMSQKRVSDSLGEWVAMKDRYKSLDECFFGKTPTEAVARLWLALNKK